MAEGHSERVVIALSKHLPWDASPDSLVIGQNSETRLQTGGVELHLVVHSSHSYAQRLARGHPGHTEVEPGAVAAGLNVGLGVGIHEHVELGQSLAGLTVLLPVCSTRLMFPESKRESKIISPNSK